MGEHETWGRFGRLAANTVFIASMVAMAVGFAALGEAFDQRGAEGVGVDFELGQQKAFPTAQGEGGFGGVEYPSHIYGQDSKRGKGVNKKENGVRMRKCSVP